MTQIKILYIHPSFIPTVLNDLEILKRHFDLRTLCYPKYTNSISFLRLLIGILRTDVNMSLFAGWRAFLAVIFSRLLSKRSVVIIGGWEVAKIPEIPYGAFCYRRLAFIVKFILRNADKVLPVDKSLELFAIKHAKVDGKNIQSIPTGYDSEFFKPIGEKENIVITVSGINKITAKRKGLKTFVAAASYLPDVEFLLIGGCGDDSLAYLKSIAPPNVQFTGFIPNNELPKYYSQAKVYCQLSIHEGLPNALCEAMLCECVPVGTKHCGIPTAIGDTGFYVPYGDPKATAEAIKKALNSNKGKEARERIKKMFTMERRERELTRVIEEVMHKNRKGQLFAT